MKFKATFSDRGLHVLHMGFLPALEKFGKKCQILLGPEDVHLVQSTVNTDGPHVSARLAIEVLFEPATYKIQSRHQNLIAVDCEIGMLMRVLKAACNNDTDVLEVKLAMRQVASSTSGVAQQKPFLSFIGKGQNVNMVQDLPISKPYSPSEIDRLAEEKDMALCPFYLDLQPEVNRLQAVVDKLKSISSSLTIHCLKTGDIHLQVSEPGLHLGAEFRSLAVLPTTNASEASLLRETTADGRLRESQNAGVCSSVVMQSKHFSRALQSSQSTQPAQLLCGVAEDASHLHFMFVFRDPMSSEGYDDSMNLSYMLPVKDEL